MDAAAPVRPTAIISDNGLIGQLVARVSAAHPGELQK